MHPVNTGQAEMSVAPSVMRSYYQAHLSTLLLSCLWLLPGNLLMWHTCHDSRERATEYAVAHWVCGVDTCRYGTPL